MSDFRIEFPDYPENDIPPELLATPWKDRSRQDDACPSFSREVGNGREAYVFVDHADPDLREWQGSGRFHVHICDMEEGFIYDEPEFEFYTLREALAFVRAHEEFSRERDAVIPVAGPEPSRQSAAGAMELGRDETEKAVAA
jgi:hypothetical protein